MHLAPIFLLSHPPSSSVTKQKSDKVEKRLVSFVHRQRAGGGGDQWVSLEKIFFYASYIFQRSKQAELLYQSLSLSPLPSLPVLIHILHSAPCCSHTADQMNTH